MLKILGLKNSQNQTLIINRIIQPNKFSLPRYYNFFLQQFSLDTSYAIYELLSEIQEAALNQVGSISHKQLRVNWRASNRTTC